MRKKLLCYLMVCCMLLGSTMSVNASDSLISTEEVINMNSDDEQIQKLMLRILDSVECEKENYGLGNADFSKIVIGNRIPAYEVKNGQLEELAIRMYPVLVDDIMVSQFWACKDSENDEWYVQLDDSLVEETINNVGLSSYCYVYAKEGVYTYSRGEIKLISFATDEISVEEEYSDIAEDTRGNIVQITDMSFENISYSKNDVFAILNTNISGKQANEARGSIVIPRTKYLDVKKISQPAGTGICWAVAMASLLSYIKHTTITYQSIVDTYGAGDYSENAGATMTQVLRWMNNYPYVAQYEEGTANPHSKKVLDELEADFPSLGWFTYSGKNHVVVIRGCSSNGTFSVMNPSPTSETSGYVSGTISSSKTWQFIYNGTTWTMFGRLHRSGIEG